MIDWILGNLDTVIAGLGLLAILVTLLVDRLIVRRKRISYRVSLSTPVSLSPTETRDSSTADDRDGLEIWWQGRQVRRAGVAVLRIENTGGARIRRQDMDPPLAFHFHGRQVVWAKISEPEPDEAVRRHLLNHGGPRIDGDRLRLPQFALDREESFKLLVMLSGEGKRISASGGIGNGRIVRESTGNDPRLRSRVLLGTALVLAAVAGLSVLVGPAMVSSAGIACRSGRLAIEGSTAFAPVAADVVAEYRRSCPSARISVTGTGSIAGVRDLQTAAMSGDVERIAMSDGPAPDQYSSLMRRPVAVTVFAVVVNAATGVYELTTAQVKGIYSGQFTNWSQLGGHDLPISIVGRGAESGTRRAFETRVLARPEPAITSNDCRTADRDPDAPIIRCEVAKTGTQLEMINRVPGAIGYAEVSQTARVANVNRVQLGGRDADIETIKQGGYPFWAMEYFYTYGQPKNDSLTAALLAYLGDNAAKYVLRREGYIPCINEETLADSLCR